MSAGDKYMPKMPLRQPGFMYTACGPVLVWTKKKYKGREELKKGEVGCNAIHCKLYASCIYITT